MFNKWALFTEWLKALYDGVNIKLFYVWTELVTWTITLFSCWWAGAPACNPDSHFSFPFPVVCCSAQLSTAAGISLVRWVSRLEEKTLGREDGDVFHNRTSFSRLLCVLPYSSQKPPWTVHPKAIYQVHLPHSILFDFFVPAAACLSAHRQVRLEQARSTTNHRRVDDITMGPG